MRLTFPRAVPSTVAVLCVPCMVWCAQTCVAAPSDARAASGRQQTALPPLPSGYADPHYPWGAEAFTYFATRTPLPILFNDFGTQFQVPVTVDSRVRGLTDGRLSATTPTAFLDAMAVAHRLDWFYAKERLYISRRLDRVARPVPLSGRSGAEAERVLGAMGVFKAGYGFVPMPREGRVLVSGPPAYVDLVAASLASLPGDAEPMRFGFFPLRHARVYDRTYKFRGDSVVVPGLHQMVAQLLGGVATSNEAPRIGSGRSGAADRAGRADQDNRDAPGRLRGTIKPEMGLNGGYGAFDGRGEPEGFGGSGLRVSPLRAIEEQDAEWASSAAVSGTSAITVVADRRLNALIVRGPSDVVEASRALIEKLDVPVPLVQLEVVIIDIRDVDSEALGVDWTVSTPYLSVNTTRAEEKAGQSLISILPSGRPVMARIQALEKEGRARVISRPTILAQNNTAALLDLSESFFIRNTGRDVANTTEVTAGLLLNIVPGVVDPESALPRVTMDIQIEDGEISPMKDSDVPRTKRNTISTQASVRSSESLMIAGHHKRTESANENGVPGLSKLPWVGGLFRNTSSETQIVKRYFIITPRVLSLEHADFQGRPAAMQADADAHAVMAGDGPPPLIAPLALPPVALSPPEDLKADHAPLHLTEDAL